MVLEIMPCLIFRGWKVLGGLYPLPKIPFILSMEEFKLTLDRLSV